MQNEYIHPQELKKRFEIEAKKKLGQNFLVHFPTLKTLSQKVLTHQPDFILEIGPGPAALSQFWFSQSCDVCLVEKDTQFKDLLLELSQNSSAQIYFEDFLNFDLRSVLKEHYQKAIAVGNLPYNVSVAILNKLLEQRAHFHSFYLMFQKEVADRIVAKPGTKAYGSLSVWCQAQMDCRIIMPIPPSAFDPRPKIHSAVVEFQKKKTELGISDFKLFENILSQAFNPRRKTLLNNLKNFLNAEEHQKIKEKFTAWGWNAMRRGETLSLEEFVMLEEALSGVD